MTDKVTINLNMFSPFMKNIIMSNLNSTYIVTVDRVVEERETTISYRRHRNQRSSEVVSAKTQYFVLVLE
jgi:hypothetical protein